MSLSWVRADGRRGRFEVGIRSDEEPAPGERFPWRLARVLGDGVEGWRLTDEADDPGSRVTQLFSRGPGRDALASAWELLSCCGSALLAVEEGRAEPASRTTPVDEILATLERLGPSTTTELAAALGAPIGRIGGRLVDLEAAGEIEAFGGAPTGKRGKVGNSCRLWAVVVPTFDECAEDDVE